nr:glycosyltransferase family A protein [uncultured Carboxylicivirga sp.]
MIRLSVIIPMYNVAPYVERCIRSLENQDIPKDQFELICINDGSPDNCSNIVEDLKREFNNILLINQENQGVSRARNNGIKKAKGEYLLFIDPDDYVEPNSFNRVLNNVSAYNAEVSFLGFTVFNEFGKERIRIFNEKFCNERYIGIDAYFAGRGDGQTDPDRMWAILYKSEFIKKNKLFFLPNVPYLEDGELIARILCLAKICIFDGHSFYQRTSRPGSATHSNLYYSEKAINGFLIAAQNLKQFQAQTNLSPEQKKFLNQPINKFVLLTLNAALQKPVFKNYLKIKRCLKDVGFSKLGTDGLQSPYKELTPIYNSFLIYFLFRAFYRNCKSFIKQIVYNRN